MLTPEREYLQDDTESIEDTNFSISRLVSTHQNRGIVLGLKLAVRLELFSLRIS